MTESFPRQEARTRRFTLGVPRAFRISPDGTRVAYLRTQGGSDPVTCLWVLDVGGGPERLVADPRTLGGDEEDLPPQERARRERVREQAGGIVAYATDADLTVAVFSWSGRVYAVDLTRPDATPHEVAVPGPALDPRPDPTGKRLAYVCAGALRVASLADPAEDQVLADPQGAPHVTFGLAEFIAAEEMDRHRGYWWSPDGSALLVARVDETPVTRWHIADPANPERPPAKVAYPAAGTPNAAGVPPAGQAGRHHRGRRDRPRRVPLPGDRLLGGRARPAGGGAEPRPADDAAAGRRRRHRPGRGAARGHRPALAGDRSRRPRLDRGRPAGVDG